MVLYRTERLAFVQFETREWPGYREYGNYAIAGIFRPENYGGELFRSFGSEQSAGCFRTQARKKRLK